MKIPSTEIPQADKLEDVVKTVIAVANGAHSYQEIAKYIDKVERQGRYYRKAAEIIGLIQTPRQNHSTLTSLGNDFIQNTPTIASPELLKGVMSSRIFQRLIPFLENKSSQGASKDQIETFLKDTAELGAASMAPRRVSSFIAWLKALNLITVQGDQHILTTSTIHTNLPIVEFNNTDEPLLPTINELKEYQIVKERVLSAQQTVTVFKDQAKTDRANDAHRVLVNLVSERIRDAGSIPKYNQFIDLATRYNEQEYIFEMKSVTPNNESSQIRSGLSQLYEYRYLQNLPNAKLVLVIEKFLSAKEHWRLDYLENDRDIFLIWDGNNELYGSSKTQGEFDFLGLIQQ